MEQSKWSKLLDGCNPGVGGVHNNADHTGFGGGISAVVFSACESACRAPWHIDL